MCKQQRKTAEPAVAANGDGNLSECIMAIKRARITMNCVKACLTMCSSHNINYMLIKVHTHFSGEKSVVLSIVALVIVCFFEGAG